MLKFFLLLFPLKIWDSHSDLAGSRETYLAAEACTKKWIPFDCKYTLSKTVTIELMIVVTVMSKRSRLYGVSYTYIIKDTHLQQNIR